MCLRPNFKAVKRSFCFATAGIKHPTKFTPSQRLSWACQSDGHQPVMERSERGLTLWRKTQNCFKSNLKPGQPNRKIRAGQSSGRQTSLCFHLLLPWVKRAETGSGKQTLALTFIFWWNSANREANQETEGTRKIMTRCTSSQLQSSTRDYRSSQGSHPT